MSGPEAPFALLAELTHRCPLQCPYCSNPLELERARGELDTNTWMRVFDEAAALGVLQVHFSGGEPTARRDVVALVRHASATGLYTNLITSGVMLDHARVEELVAAGLDHVQISFQDVDDAEGDRVAGYRDAQRLKRRAAVLVRQAGLPLTLNAVMHRQNLARLPGMIELALELGAGRLEVAHVQYYGWGFSNRAALLPSRAQLEEATEIVEAARARLKSRLVIDYVVPDYHAMLPKACMGGWGRRFLNVTPIGKVLPCHAAETLPGLDFPSVKEASLTEIWYRSDAFNRFRGTSWMPEPCRSCDRREVDWGGCRCQAFALAGDAAATDPVCYRSSERAAIDAALVDTDATPPPFVYRRIGGGPRGEAPVSAVEDSG
jgi:pyrroloquinoline quinone biosynthesis protein E